MSQEREKTESEKRQEQRKSLIDEMGFVTREDLENAYQEFMIELDQAVWPESERYPSRRHLLEWAESYKFRLLKRSRHNIDEHLKYNPTLKAQLRQERDKEAEEKSKKSWEERRRLGAQWSQGGG